MRETKYFLIYRYICNPKREFDLKGEEKERKGKERLFKTAFKRECFNLRN